MSPESRFCNGCGISVVANEPVKTTTSHSSVSIPLAAQIPPIIPSQLQGKEEVVFRIRPSFYAVSTTYIGAAIFSLLAIAVFGYFALPIGISLTLSLASFIVPMIRHIQRNRVTYTLTSSKIEIEYGLVSKTVRNIPLRAAQDVTISATLFERIIGVGDVIVDSAAEAGKILMRQIPDPRKHADLILHQLQRIHSLR